MQFRIELKERWVVVSTWIIGLVMIYQTFSEVIPVVGR